MNSLRDLSRNQLFVLISLLLLYGVISSIWFGQPIIFENPVTLCFKTHDGQQTTYPCQEIKACQQFYQTHHHDDRNYTSIIDYSASKYSLSLVHQLICKNRKLKFDTLYMINSSMYLAYVILFSIILNNTKFTKIVIMLSFVATIIGHLVIIFSNSFNIVKWSLSVIGFARTGIYVFIIDIFTNYFNSEVFKMSAVLTNMSFSVYGLFYPIISVLFHGNYIILNIMDATILSIGFLIYIFNIYKMQPQQSMRKRMEAKNSLFPISLSYSQILEMFGTPNKMTFLVLVVNSIYFNFLCCAFYLFADGFQGASEITIILNICSVIGTVLCGYIVVQYDIYKSYQVVTLIIGLFLSITIFLPPSIYQTSRTLENILIGWVVFTQIFVDILFAQYIILTQQCIDSKFINFIQNFGGFMARVIILGIPELSYTLKNVYQIDIYFLYGIVGLALIPINACTLGRAKRNVNVSSKQDITKTIQSSHSSIAIINYMNEVNQNCENVVFDQESDYVELGDLTSHKIIQ